MRQIYAIAFVVIGCGAATVLAQTERPDPQQIRETVDRLGSLSFRDREAASKKLEKIGEPAIEFLAQAGKSPDLEKRRRAIETISRIQARLENARLLAPTRMRLVLTDEPLPSAVKKFTSLSGIPIALGGDPSKYIHRRVTIDTGDVTFWEVLDQFGAKSGLVEQDMEVVEPQSMPSQIGSMPVQIQIPIQAIPAAPALPPRLPAPRPPVPGKKPIPIPPQRKADPAQPAARGPMIPQPIPAQPQPIPPAIPPVQPPLPIQPPQVVMPQVQIFMRGGAIRMPGMPGHQSNAPVVSQITLVDGTQKPRLTSIDGAVRVRILPTAYPGRPDIAAGELWLPLEIAFDPKLKQATLQSVSVLSAIGSDGEPIPCSDALANSPASDDVVFLGQATMPANPSGTTFKLLSNGRIREPADGIRSLKEVRGTVRAVVRTGVEPLLNIDQVGKSKDRTFSGSGGTQLRVVDIKTDSNGDVTMQIEIRHPTEVQLGMPGGSVGPGMSIPGLPPGVVVAMGEQDHPWMFGQNAVELADENGDKFAIAKTQKWSFDFDGQSYLHKGTYVFRPTRKDIAQPAKLIVKGSRQSTLVAGFTFRDVPLP
jgi:hypothetical protein